jgi:periplasmic protein TonB
MFATTRFAAVAAGLLLCVGASQVAAADRSARIDLNGCEKPELASRYVEEDAPAKVTVAYLVDTTGAVVASKVVESSGNGRIDRASTRAGAKCKFKPASKDGQDLISWAKVTYAWIVD